MNHNLQEAHRHVKSDKNDGNNSCLAGWLTQNLLSEHLLEPQRQCHKLGGGWKPLQAACWLWLEPESLSYSEVKLIGNSLFTSWLSLMPLMTSYFSYVLTSTVFIEMGSWIILNLHKHALKVYHHISQWSLKFNKIHLKLWLDIGHSYRRPQLLALWPFPPVTVSLMHVWPQELSRFGTGQGKRRKIQKKARGEMPLCHHVCVLWNKHWNQ